MEFGEVIDFLATYSWVYDFKVTQFFQEKVWKHVPVEWAHYLTSLSLDELSALPHGVAEDMPSTLKDFIETAQKFSLLRRVTEDVESVDIIGDLLRGMRHKKQHEVSRFAAVLQRVMVHCGASVMIDVGAGLGYLGQVMNAKYGVKVISLECEDVRCQGSNQRVCKNDLAISDFLTITHNLSDAAESCFDLYGIITDFLLSHKSLSPPSVMSGTGDRQDGIIDSAKVSTSNHDLIQREKESCIKENVASFNHKKQLNCVTCVNCESCCTNVNSLRTTVEKSSKLNAPVVMVGLHCCGDLTPTMLRHFVQLDCIAALCCVSCCYHRMKISQGCAINFPMSQECQTALSSRTWGLGQYALRLAAQDTRERWVMQNATDHVNHTRHVAYRSLLDLYLMQEQLVVSKKKRVLVRKAAYSNLDEYVVAAWKNLSLESQNVELGNMKQKMSHLYEQYEPYFVFIEPITMLQVILQSVIESLIYRDRLAYLHQLPLTQASIHAVFDVTISPRNLAIIAHK